MQLIDTLFQLVNHRGRAEQGGFRKLTAEIGIEVEAAMAERRQLPGEMLGSLDTRMPVGHWQKQNIGLAAGLRQGAGKRQGREIPTVQPLRGPRLRVEPEVEPLEVKGPDPFFEWMIVRCVGANAFIVGEAKLAR